MSHLKPRAVDLFCGAGGLSQGLRQAGFNVIGAVENDELACEAYRLNQPDVALWERDIRRLSAKQCLRQLELKKGQLELLAACPPCQGFSTMRTKNGLRKNRDRGNDLIFEVLRFVRSMLPLTVMIENVPGLARNQRFEKFRNGLCELGYEVKHRVLNVADYGVPQSRRRLVLLASKCSQPSFAKKAFRLRTVRDAIKHLTATRNSRDPLHGYKASHSAKVVKLIRRIPKNGGSRSALGASRQLRCHKSFDGFRDVYGRMAWDRPAPTITSGCINPSKGRFLHPTANRAITLREAALLQTFPRRYKFPHSRGRYPIALLIGNALPPEFIKRHAMSLRKDILKVLSRSQTNL